MGPVRDLGSDICRIDAANMPPIAPQHFQLAMQSMRPSVSPSEICHYIKWNKEFGSCS
ncbi:unnamed protein product, partial [Phaeothamnion confervicola]